MQSEISVWTNMAVDPYREGMESSLRDMVARRLLEIGVSPIKAAEMRGLKREFLYDLILGKKQSVRADKLADLAHAIYVDPSALSQGRLVRQAVPHGTPGFHVSAYQSSFQRLLDERDQQALDAGDSPWDGSARLIEDHDFTNNTSIEQEAWEIHNHDSWDDAVVGEDPSRLTRLEDHRRRVRSGVVVPDLALHAGMGGGGAIEIRVDPSGRPSDPDDWRGYWELPAYMVSRLGNLQNIYAWEVRGDSMEPTIQGGSVVFVDVSQNIPPPDDIYAINYGDGLMVKRLKLTPRTDKVSVISDNVRYAPDELLREDVTVWGRVVGWFQWRG